MSRFELPRQVSIVEVGPRDGLQNEAVTLSVSDRAAFVAKLADAGHSLIEVGAFVSPRWVPQMADTASVLATIERRPGIRYSALVPNLEGLEAAIQANVSDIAVFAAASDTFSQRNINATIEQSLARYSEVARRALDSGLRVRAYLSTAFGCPYEGAVPISRVVHVAERLRGIGAFEVAISDTIGVAHPGQVWHLLDALSDRVPVQHVALHFHDTRGTALANVLAGLQAGVSTFDASAGGLGGCPYAPGAAGNLATEDLVYMLDGLGITTGVRLDALLDASAFVESRLGHALPSRYAQAARARRAG